MDRQSGESRTLAIVLNRDLIFGSRIRGALASLGLRPQVVKTAAELRSALESSAAETAIAIIDMNQPLDWETLAQALQVSVDPPPFLAFGPHVDVENRRAAKAAGVTRIVSNGQFHREMVDLIARYRRN